MHRFWPIVSVVLLFPSPVLSQALPEGVHSDSTGPSDECGVSGNDALDIRAKLKKDPTIVEKPSGSSRFETFFASAGGKQWTVTTKGDAAYPAVTCVRLFDSGGGTEMEREMRCDASREACDALFLEFQASDEEIRRQIKGR